MLATQQPIPSNTDLQGISFYLTPLFLSGKCCGFFHYLSHKLKTNGFFSAINTFILTTEITMC